MNGFVENEVTCADPGPCAQVGTDTVVLGGVPVEFCSRHAANHRDWEAERAASRAELPDLAAEIRVTRDADPEPAPK